FGDDAVPARGIGEGAVNEDDGRLGLLLRHGAGGGADRGEERDGSEGFLHFASPFRPEWPCPHNGAVSRSRHCTADQMVCPGGRWRTTPRAGINQPTGQATTPPGVADLPSRPMAGL